MKTPETRLAYRCEQKLHEEPRNIEDCFCTLHGQILSWKTKKQLSKDFQRDAYKPPQTKAQLLVEKLHAISNLQPEEQIELIKDCLINILEGDL